MNRMRPFIDVSVDGRPVSGLFYELLNKATIHDAPGQESDSAELTFDDGGNRVAVPRFGALVEVRFGFEDAPAWKMGVFTYEKASVDGGDGGEFLTLHCRSADRRADLKETRSEHFDEMTVGGIVEELAGRHGLGAKVDPAFASIKLPYVARLNQSAPDFLTRLADRMQAQFAVKDRKFLFLRRGALPAMSIDRGECISWSFEIEPRPAHGRTEAAWFDREAGVTRIEEHSTGLQGPLKRLRTVHSNRDEAKRAAAAEGDRLGRATGSGSLSLAGRPEIMADQPLVTTGFRSEVNGEWRVAGVDHVFGDTYTTDISLEAPESGKE